MSSYSGTGSLTHVFTPRFVETVSRCLSGGHCGSWSARMLLDRAVEDESRGDPQLRQFLARQLPEVARLLERGAREICLQPGCLGLEMISWR
jgi:hypothetical protein